ncbi:glycoside hydrolase family 57 protein [Anaeromyxobacter sp. Fw109-5]|uniref:glycoside hydrolase family 57 protein n=1 Tax=Anaeromyxobacter sp. (strain Fw109-5) TaxID=404589 RepID=UPI0000ED7847|nr:glycoside hydrolase family 57 protein [Anaeromyxobacter sp. Fw109-5]ABS24353.1 glycoside hydrolase family 57 [Anaeromyxobacter sp. Fw109-5]
MQKARLALLWHMHQPPYRDADTGEYLLPWVRLHATRAYNDMAWMLERHPALRCTVNFTPILLEQLEDYVAGRARDRFLELSARPASELGHDERSAVVRGFFMVDWGRNVRPVPRYWELLHKRGQDLGDRDPRRLAAGFSDADLTDLQVHFNLAWMGFGALADDEGLRALREKGRDFDRADVAYLLEAQRRILAGVVPRWTRLAERGQVELSTTPYYHPILPLLCDSDAARRALPHLPLPPRFAHPEDARWHVREALASHERRFGHRPAGMWPAEGSVSPEAVEVLAREGVRWAASDEGVLLHSLPPTAPRLASVYRPWRIAAGEGRELTMLFRDRALSDAIGFTYAGVPAQEAAGDFVANVGAIARAWEAERLPGRPTVGVFLDGENAWEHYPESGREFLDRLYGGLAVSDAIETVTLSEATADAESGIVTRIHSGSWIEASYRVWIGHAEDRHAWTALGRARAALAEAERQGSVDAGRLEQARRHLHAAEASDWFWWYGDDFSTDLGAEFDGLFRGHVVRACLLIGATPPAEVLEPIKRVAPGAEARAAREPTALLAPRIDGRETTFFEWAGAGVHRPGQHRGSMFGGAQAFRELHFGFGLDALYLRLDPAESPARSAEVVSHVRVVILAGERQATVELAVVPDGAVRPGRAAAAELGEAAFGKVLEARLPFAALGLVPGGEVALGVHAVRGEVEVERLPRHGFVRFTVPDADFERVHWKV